MATITQNIQFKYTAPRFTTHRGLHALARAAVLAAAGAALLLSAATVAGQEPPPVPTAPVVATNANDTGDFVTETPGARRHIELLLNKSIELTTRTAYTRISVSQPDIADFTMLDKGKMPRKLLLTGKKIGTTQVMIWDAGDKASVFDVSVIIDVAGPQAELDKLFPELHLKVESVNGILRVRGHVPSTGTAEQVMQIAKTFAPNVMDGLEISGGQQICLQVRFAEVSRTASTALGINGAFSTTKGAFGNNIAQVNPTALVPGGAANTTNQTLSLSDAVTLYGSGQVGSVLLEGFIDALRENDLMRVLAEPNLVTVSGQEASFLAGGSFPVPVAQGGGTGSGAVITIQYEDYGIKLKFTPVILGNGRIRLKLSPEVSDLDYANGVTLNNFVVPGTTVRNLTTTVELADGQTFAVAGLLSSNITADKTVTPFLGDLPVVGALFRSVRYSNADTELVVLVTPHLVEPLNPAETPQMPGEKWETPSEVDMFLNQYMGGDRSTRIKAPTTQEIKQLADNHQAPAFYGQVGFVPPPQAAPGPATTPTAKN